LVTVILLVVPEATRGITSVAPVVVVTAGNSEILTSAAHTVEHINIKTITRYFFISPPYFSFPRISSNFLFIVSKGFAHGTNELGPNQGLINMPGNYHTELVALKNGTFKVYLIDINFKNPTTLNSSVSLKLISNKKTIDFKCSPEPQNYFLCASSDIKKIPNTGKVEIKSMRDKSQGGVATYELPAK
jgi:hypothetical protein